MKSTHHPWNAGRAVGQKKAFTVKQARSLKKILRRKGKLRDLVLASVAFDTALRSCDLLALEWIHLISDSGALRNRITVRQQKTRANVTVELSPETLDLLRQYRKEVGGEYLFPGHRKSGALSGRQYRRLVKEWARMLELDPDRYGTHSLRRTKPAELYRRTRDPEIVRIILGQKSLVATHYYLGIGQEEALECAREIEI